MIDWTTVRDRVPAAAATPPTTLDALVASATAWLEEQTGRYLSTPVAVTEYLAGLGGYELFLRDRLASGTPTVTERVAPTAAETPVTGFESRVGRGTTLLRTDGQLWRQGYEYKVVYTRGYAVETGPPDLRQLVLDLVALKLSAQDLEGVQSGSIGNFSFALADGGQGLGQIPGADAVIRAWRRPVMA